ncbi:MAG: CHASE3 domain-containing protein [Steroidobacteraceae bacterium]
MPEISFPGFDKRYVLMPMLAAVAMVMVSYFVTEERRSYVMNLNAVIRDRQERMRELADLIYANADAESAQRGFLLTGDPDYLAPFDGAETQVKIVLNGLLAKYGKRDLDEMPHLSKASKLIDSKFHEMHATIDLAKHSWGKAEAVRLIKTDIGLLWMAQLREELEGMRGRERSRVYADIENLEHQININRYISAATSALSILLLLGIGILITRDIKRRSSAAAMLDKLVVERTRELTELSKYMLNATEREKARLARELHDELGGLLVAIKMDLVQLAKKFDFTHADVQSRWQRIQGALASGVSLKRRVIEELRPTLLDNMGLLAALRWQAEETCTQANMALTVDLPVEEPRLDAGAAIAVFRVAQEALLNIAKHSRATSVVMRLDVSDRILVLAIEDNGIGLPDNAEKRIGSHGMLSMKYRIQAVGGTFHVEPVVPNGTRVIACVPQQSMNKS